MALRKTRKKKVSGKQGKAVKKKPLKRAKKTVKKRPGRKTARKPLKRAVVARAKTKALKRKPAKRKASTKKAAGNPKAKKRAGRKKASKKQALLLAKTLKRAVKARAGKTVHAGTEKPSNEEMALMLLDTYFSEIARYKLKRQLTLDEVINAYFYALLRVERKGIEVEAAKRLLLKGKM